MILDLGAGKGRLTGPLGLSGFHVVACDISLEMLKTAVKRIRSNKIKKM